MSEHVSAIRDEADWVSWHCHAGTYEYPARLQRPGCRGAGDHDCRCMYGFAELPDSSSPRATMGFRATQLHYRLQPGRCDDAQADSNRIRLHGSDGCFGSRPDAGARLQRPAARLRPPYGDRREARRCSAPSSCWSGLQPLSRCSSFGQPARSVMPILELRRDLSCPADPRRLLSIHLCKPQVRTLSATAARQGAKAPARFDH